MEQHLKYSLKKNNIEKMFSSKLFLLCCVPFALAVSNPKAESEVDNKHENDLETSDR